MSNQNLSPTVSVLMSVYNEPLDWIQQAIDSILTQTFNDFEFIIVNDKPDRMELKDFLERNTAKDSRIRIHTNPENIGLTKSLNVGLKLCTGKYIARMDADDISLPERFQKQVEYLNQHNQVIVVGTDIKYFGDVPKMTYSDWINPNDNEIKAQMLSNSGFAHPTVMIRHACLLDNKIEYDENYRQGQDYRLWELLYDFGEFANIKEKLLNYRLSNHQVSKRSNSVQVNLGVNIRRRLIYKWLNRNGIVNLNIETLTLNDINKFIIPAINHRTNESIFLSLFLKTYYFSRSKKRFVYFTRSIINRHFFMFSIKNMCRYCAIVLGLKEPVKW